MYVCRAYMGCILCSLLIQCKLQNAVEGDMHSSFYQKLSNVRI